MLCNAMQTCVEPHTLHSVYVHSFYRMLREFVKCWVTYRDPIDLMDRPSYMETWTLVYVYIKYRTNNKWTYVLMEHLIVDLKTIFALASNIVDLNAYELHSWNGFIDES